MLAKHLLLCCAVFVLVASAAAAPNYGATFRSLKAYRDAGFRAQDINECPVWSSVDGVDCLVRDDPCTDSLTPDSSTDPNDDICTAPLQCNSTCADVVWSSEGDLCESDADCYIDPQAELDGLDMKCHLPTNGTNQCRYTINIPVPEGCRADGDLCKVNSDCYTPLTCSRGVCTGAANGFACSSTQECTRGHYCTSQVDSSISPSVCRAYISDGEPTLSADVCASQLAIDDPDNPGELICLSSPHLSLSRGSECDVDNRLDLPYQCTFGTICNETTGTCDDVQFEFDGAANNDFISCIPGTAADTGLLQGFSLCNQPGGTHKCFEMAGEYCRTETLAYYQTSAFDVSKRCQRRPSCDYDGASTEWFGSCSSQSTSCAKAEYEACLSERKVVDFEISIGGNGGVDISTICGYRMPSTSSDSICSAINSQASELESRELGSNTVAASIMVPVVVVLVAGLVFACRTRVAAAVDDKFQMDAKRNALLVIAINVICFALIVTALATTNWASGKQADDENTGLTGGAVGFGLINVCVTDSVDGAVNCSPTDEMLTFNAASISLLQAILAFAIVALLTAFVAIVTSAYTIIKPENGSEAAKFSMLGSTLVCVCSFFSFCLFAAFYNDEGQLENDFEPTYPALSLGWSWVLLIIAWVLSAVAIAPAYRVSTDLK